MVIKELKTATAQNLKDINVLLRQLVHDPSTYAPVPLPKFRRMLKDKKIVTIVAIDNSHIVGVALLMLVTKFRGDYAYVEDMMVDEHSQGRGIGTAIGKKVIEIAKKKKVQTIELSTRPARVAANKLYQKLGFEQKETNVYRLKL